MIDFIPSVVYNGSGTQRVSDVFSRLLSDRAIMLVGPIDASLANIVIAQLLHLEAENPGADIQMYINSPGGEVYSALAIYDVMQAISSKVETICVGDAASAASFILASGDRRLITAHSRVLIHQPLGGQRGQAVELKNYTKEIYRLYEIMIEIYIRHTKLTRPQLEHYFDRDSIFEPHEAIEYGIVDGLVQKRKGKTELKPGNDSANRKKVDDKIEQEVRPQPKLSDTNNNNGATNV
jgi:ATP-dependent Clp protease protease subunit